jgi:hypothetical protein
MAYGSNSADCLTRLITEWAKLDTAAHQAKPEAPSLTREELYR